MNSKPSTRQTLVERVMAWPRLARMGVVFAGAMALALLLMPLIDDLFFRLTGLFVGQSPWPTYIVLAMCMGLYLAGYVYVIGLPGNPPPAGRAQTIYLRIVAAILFATLLWYAALILSVSGEL